jgi:hypothetical protein
MNTAAEQIESSSDIERLRDRGVAELADQFSKARAQIRKMIDMRLDRKLLGRIDASTHQTLFRKRSSKRHGDCRNIWMRQKFHRTCGCGRLDDRYWRSIIVSMLELPDERSIGKPNLANALS